MICIYIYYNDNHECKQDQLSSYVFRTKVCVLPSRRWRGANSEQFFDEATGERPSLMFASKVRTVKYQGTTMWGISWLLHPI